MISFLAFVFVFALVFGTSGTGVEVTVVAVTTTLRFKPTFGVGVDMILWIQKESFSLLKRGLLASNFSSPMDWQDTLCTYLIVAPSIGPYLPHNQ